MTHETRSRLGCPLCRCPWPEEDQVPLSEIIAQLRLCRTRKVAKLAVKLETAFQQARRRRYKKCFAWYKSSWCKGCVYDRICIFMYRTIYSRDTHTHRNICTMLQQAAKSQSPWSRWNFVLMNDQKCHTIAWDLLSCAWKKTFIRPPVFWAINSRAVTASHRSCHFWMPDMSQTCQRLVHLGSSFRCAFCCFCFCFCNEFADPRLSDRWCVCECGKIEHVHSTSRLRWVRASPTY